MSKKRLSLSSQFFWFALSGVAGFIVDSSVLYLLKGNMGLYAGRLVSFFAAAFSTWLFNRAITFREQNSGHSKAKEFGIYLFLMAIGGTINIAVYSFLVDRYSIMALHPVIGVAAGSLAGMSVNPSYFPLHIVSISAIIQRFVYTFSTRC